MIMNQNKSRLVSVWLKHIKDQLNVFFRESKNYRCKLVSIELDKKTEQLFVLVLILGIKNQIIKFFPMEIINDDTLIQEFSPLDVRAITCLAMKQMDKKEAYDSNGTTLIVSI